MMGVVVPVIMAVMVVPVIVATVVTVCVIVPRVLAIVRMIGVRVRAGRRVGHYAALQPSSV